MVAEDDGHEPEEQVRAPADLGAALRRLGREVARFAAGRLDTWQQQLNGEARAAGVTDRAVLAALDGWATGEESPARAALRTVWSGTGAVTRAALVGLVLLLLVTAPVLLLVLLVAVAIIAVALRLRRTSTAS